MTARWAVLSVALFAAVARADAVAVSLTNRVLAEQGSPSIHVQILEPISGFRLQLTSGEGRVLDVKGGGRKGVTRTIELPQGEGVTNWKGQLTIQLPSGDVGAMPLDFETQRVGRVAIALDVEHDVDLPHRTVRFRLNQPAAKAELRVLMDSGQLAFDGEVVFDGAAPGAPLTVQWPEAPGQVMKVLIRAQATSGAYHSVELTPWQLDIPHEEVNFDSRKWDLRAEERPKLDRSYALIRDAVAKFGSLAPLHLYVAGHTDTQGTSQYNRVLSRHRARAIAQYFREKGLRIPISYEGFGEEALRVSTRDEAEARENRRVEYLLTIDEPRPKATLSFTPRWQRLD